MNLFDVAVASKLSGGGGGGGSSDFTTATVTMISDYELEEWPSAAQIVDIGGIDMLSGSTGYQVSTTPVTMTVALYKGKSFVFFSDTVSTKSGGIEDGPDGGYIVTGDCTVKLMPYM